MHWTEGGAGLHFLRIYLTDWNTLGTNFHSGHAQLCQSDYRLEPALDEKARPNIVPFPADGTVDDFTPRQKRSHVAVSTGIRPFFAPRAPRSQNDSNPQPA